MLRGWRGVANSYTGISRWRCRGILFTKKKLLCNLQKQTSLILSIRKLPTFRCIRPWIIDREYAAVAVTSHVETTSAWSVFVCVCWAKWGLHAVSNIGGSWIIAIVFTQGILVFISLFFCDNVLRRKSWLCCCSPPVLLLCASIHQTYACFCIWEANSYRP